MKLKDSLTENKNEGKAIRTNPLRECPIFDNGVNGKHRMGSILQMALGDGNIEFFLVFAWVSCSMEAT